MPSSPELAHPATPRLELNNGKDSLDSDATGSSPDSRLPASRSLTAGRAGSLRSPPSNGHLQGLSSPTANDASELLLPPSRNRPRRFRDDISPSDSRRTSWSSESAGSRDSRSPFYSPFDDSRAPSRAGSDDEAVNTQTVSEKYNILPSAGLLLYPEDVEKDDYLHNPDPNDKDGLVCSELFSKRGIVNLGGLLFLGIGILLLFIFYPVYTFVSRELAPEPNPCTSNPLCISGTKPLLQNLRTGPIDPNTPSSAMTKTSSTGETLNLVFSDEFNDDDRTFYPGDDGYFTAVDLWYGVTQDLEWYDPDAITTEDGALVIQFDKYVNHDLNYRSGMLQSWNQMCFKTGLLETSISLPGSGNVSGFWPGFWALGNLARPGHPATTDGLWPYSYDDVCDAGITANQSDTSGLNLLPGMRLPACTCDGADHPSPGISRSAPEIDVIEASVSTTKGPLGNFGTASQSLQVAPFDMFWRPDTNYQEVYDYEITGMNSYQGGVYQQALSAVTNLNNDWYDGVAFQTYSFEYETGSSGYVAWTVGDVPTWKVTAESLRPNGNVAQRVIPMEPMALVANFGMSNSFAYLDTAGLLALMPAKMRIDYIRIYQDGNGELTCDPVGYPTTDYIAQHMTPYTNANLTTWASAGYSTPQNSFVDGCSSSAEPEKSKQRRAQLNCQNGVCTY